MENNAIVQKFVSVKEVVEALDLDVAKAAAGNTAAGLRVRKALRVLRREVSDVIKLTTAADKATRAERKAAKAAKKVTAVPAVV